MLSRCTARLQKRAISAAWAAWQDLVAERARYSGILQRCGARIRQRALAGAWEAWRARAVQQGGRRELLRKCGARLSQRTLAAAWRAWRERSGVLAERRRVLQNCAARWPQTHLSRAPVCVTSDEASLQQQMISTPHRCSILLARLRASALARAWSAWREISAQGTDARVRAAACLAKIRMREAAAAFAGWKEAAKAVQHVRTVLQVGKQWKKVILATEMHTFNKDASPVGSERQQEAQRDLHATVALSSHFSRP